MRPAGGARLIGRSSICRSWLTVHSRGNSNGATGLGAGGLERRDRRPGRHRRAPSTGTGRGVSVPGNGSAGRDRRANRPRGRRGALTATGSRAASGPGQRGCSGHSRCVSRGSGAERLQRGAHAGHGHRAGELVPHDRAGPGVVTSGWFDHRPHAPATTACRRTCRGRGRSTSGRADGFWAFEMERRGAEVVALELPRLSDRDFPPAVKRLIRSQADTSPGRRFELARRALGSKVELVRLTIYDIEPSRLGRFDFVHAGDVLVHLRDPVGGLSAIRSVTSGQAHIADVIDPRIAGGPGTDLNLASYQGGWDVTDLVGSVGADARADGSRRGIRRRGGPRHVSPRHARGPGALASAPAGARLSPDGTSKLRLRVRAVPTPDRGRCRTPARIHRRNTRSRGCPGC